MALDRAVTVNASLTDLIGIVGTTWTPWVFTAPVELPQVRGDTNSLIITLKGTPVADAIDNIKFRYRVFYDNGSGDDEELRESGLLALSDARFMHTIMLDVTTPVLGDGILKFELEVWRDTTNATTFDLTLGVVDIHAVRTNTGGVCYWAANSSSLSGDVVLHEGDILFAQDDNLIMRWNGASWVTIFDVSPPEAEDEHPANQISFYS